MNLDEESDENVSEEEGIDEVADSEEDVHYYEPNENQESGEEEEENDDNEEVVVVNGIFKGRDDTEWNSKPQTVPNRRRGMLIKSRVVLPPGERLDTASDCFRNAFFDRLRGLPLFRATMSCDRFKRILRFIRFDDKNTRTARRARDKLAPARDIFELINKNLV